MSKFQVRRGPAQPRVIRSGRAEIGQPASQIVFRLRQRSGRLAHFRSGFAQPYEGHLIRRRLVIDVSLRVDPRRAQLLGAFENDPQVLRLCGRTLDLELRLADLCLALLDVALQSRQPVRQGT